MRELEENTLHLLIHELKNPLTLIKGYSELIKDASINEIKDFNNIINTQTDFAIYLINNISTFNKLTEKLPVVLVKEEIKIKEIIDNIFKIYKEKTNKIKFINNIDKKFSITTDKTLFTLILFNLVENAFKYTEKGYIKLYTEDNNIIIEDTGCGISKENLDKIYDLYFRACDYIPGTGIGLYLVKEICNKLDIKINLETEVNKGTKIALTINKEN